jgi:hypothetical protein
MKQNIYILLYHVVYISYVEFFIQSETGKCPKKKKITDVDKEFLPSSSIMKLEP